MSMTPKQRLETTLNFEEPDRPPHFEQMFELVEEAFGLSFPEQEELDQSSGTSRKKLFERCAEIYYQTVKRFKWDAVLVWRPAGRDTAQYEFIPFSSSNTIFKGLPLANYELMLDYLHQQFENNQF